MIRPTATATVSRSEPTRATTPPSAGDTAASRPSSCGDAVDAHGVVRVGHEHDRRDRRRPAGTGRRTASDSQRCSPVRLPLDGVAGDAVVLEVVGAGLGLGEAVALLAAAGDDDQRGDALARRARRRGRGGWPAPATARRRTGRRRARRWPRRRRGLVAARRLPHLHEGDGEVDDARPRRRRQRPGRPSRSSRRRDQPSVARAFRRRASVRSRPRATTDSNSGGPTAPAGERHPDRRLRLAPAAARPRR